MQYLPDGVPPSLLSVDGFDRRHARQLAYERDALKGDESYGLASGDYSSNLILAGTLTEDYELLTSIPPEDPRRVSNFLAKRIGQLLETSKEPVIFLDMGAEFGITAHWLAAQFPDAIDDSSLAIGATNLSPSLAGHDSFIEFSDLIKTQELRRKSGGRVQPITSSALRLPEETITLKNGREITLCGRVSLANERAAITYWSQRPGIDIWQIGRLVAPNGVYMVGVGDCECPFFDILPKLDHVDERRQEIRLAHKELGILGLQETTVVEAGEYQGRKMSYKMFKGPEALPIAV